MSGRPDFTTPGSGGSGQTVAVSDRPEVKSIDVSSTTNVASNSVEDIDVYAPTGSVYNLTILQLLSGPDADATSGKRRFVVFSTGNMPVTLGEATYNSDLYFQDLHWRRADSDELPPGADAQIAAVQTLRATENSPIRIRFNNMTDVTHEVSRDIRMVVEEVSY